MSQRSRFFDSAGAAITLATSAAADDIIDTTTPHGFVAGQEVHFTALTGGSGLVVGTIYWVVSTSLGSQTFRVSATAGGAPINFTTDITAGTVVGGDRVYGSDALAQVHYGLMGDGVVDNRANELAVSQNGSPNMSVLVATGLAFIRGYYFEVYGSSENPTIAAAHATLNRIDRVVVRRDLSGRQAILAVLTGTPAGSPSAPALTQVEAGIWEISLAQVFVGAAVTQILNANITDERGARAQGPDIDALLDTSTGHRHEGTAGTGRQVRASDLSGTITATQHGALASASASHRHADLTSIGVDDHHAKVHAHTSAGEGGTLAHTALTAVGVNDHHNQAHAISGADHTGTISATQHGAQASSSASHRHADLTSVTADQHHTENHASRHAVGQGDVLTPAAIGSFERSGTDSGNKVYVQSASPSSPTNGDVWIKG